MTGNLHWTATPTETLCLEVSVIPSFDKFWLTAVFVLCVGSLTLKPYAFRLNSYTKFWQFWLTYSRICALRGVPQTPTLRILLKLQPKPWVLGFFDNSPDISTHLVQNLEHNGQDLNVEHNGQDFNVEYNGQDLEHKDEISTISIQISNILVQICNITVKISNIFVEISIFWLKSLTFRS